ncbi:hypothetical protein MNBD_GAMMA12-957 [hydrothermal vent metagenome]|uniref:Uncharacterized protein n=1 Tax=hydrothermal vent metagenome TaxID=652676 RepID=A0A3B0Z486_9ZZZZ
MTYILTSKIRKTYLSGIFKIKGDAEEYLRKYPDNVKSNTSLERIDCVYPFFITEDEKGFRYFDEVGVSKVIEELVQDPVSDEEYCYTNLYRVAEDYFCNKPGKDYMGIIQHWHIENSLIREIKSNGLNSLWS